MRGWQLTGIHDGTAKEDDWVVDKIANAQKTDIFQSPRTEISVK